MPKIHTDRYVSDFLNHLEQNYRYNTARNYRYAVLDFLQYLETTGYTLKVSQDQNSTQQTSSNKTTTRPPLFTR